MSNLTLSITTIGDLLLRQKITNGDKPIEDVSLNIPIYQRPYKWTARNAIQLLDDIIEAMNSNKEKYRVGTLILHQQKGDRYDIVDGQQRTITFSLLLTALGEKDISFLQQSVYNNEHNCRNIPNNYQALCRRIGKKSEDKNDEHEKEKERLKGYIENNCELIVVITKDISEAFQFFDSQNARGKALYPHDLLKAYHLREMAGVSEEETEKIVSVGDPVIHYNDYRLLNENILAARALDDRLGAFIALETLKRVKEKKTKNGVFVSTTVGEETTGRGAKSAVNLIKPTCALIVDVTYANDVKHLEKCSGEVSLNKGPVLTYGSLMNRKMHEMMVELCKKNNIKMQFDLSPSMTYTDTDDMFSSYDGIPCYLVSIPLRYMHSSVEVCDLRDVEKIIELFTDREINSGTAQLLFTSHDLTTMSNDVLRRDEIWFSAINGYDESVLYSLVDFRKEGGNKPRNDENYSKQYMEGRYGADPYFKKLIDWEVSD